MTDEERERELRKWCGNTPLPPAAISLVVSEEVVELVKATNAILAALDVDWFKTISDEGTIAPRNPREYRESIVRAMHAAIFGEEAK